MTMQADSGIDTRDDHEVDVDLVVVGSGAAGLCAALRASELGVGSILVAEAEGVVGGSSRLSGGLVMGAGTRVQAAAGIDDHPDELFHDYMQANRWNVDAAVVRRLCDEAGRVVDWLCDLGVEYHPQLVRGGDERTPRVHVPVGAGQAVIDVLHRHCRERGIDVALGRRVDRLLVTDGRVCGVAVGDDEIRARATILATGGFGASPEKLAALYPSAAAAEWTWYIGSEGARGDAIDLVEQVDGVVVGHDRGLRLLDVGFDKVYEAFLPGWLMMVGPHGRRFIDETAPYGLLDHAVRLEGGRVFVVFDQAALDATLHAGADQWSYGIPGHTRTLSSHWNPDLVEMMVTAGRVHRCDDLGELAGRLGVDPDGLAGTVAQYNGFSADGVDRHLGKKARFLRPVATGPFYGAELRPATVCSTACGPRISPDAEVLGVDGSSIPGLYAGGECTGGVVGALYVGSGNNYANATAMGFVAGQSAAAFVTARRGA